MRVILFILLASIAYTEDVSYKELGREFGNSIKPNTNLAPIVEGATPNIDPKNMVSEGEKLKETADYMKVVKEGVDIKNNYNFSEEDANFLDRAKNIQENPESYADFLKGKYSDCEVGSKEVFSKEEHICDDYTLYTEKQCAAGKIVEVDAQHMYQCSSGVKRRECDRKLKVECQRSEDCDAHGIVLKTISSDMKWVYKYPELTLGTIADNYWTGNCQKYDRTTTFEIKNTRAIDEFKIIEVGYDDHMRVEVNGHQVFIGPNDGNKLVVENVLERNIYGYEYYVPKVNTGKSIVDCELYISRKDSKNIDIKPYLKEGVNTIRIEVLVSGAGEGWIKIRTKQHCCKGWTEKWVEECWSAK